MWNIQLLYDKKGYAEECGISSYMTKGQCKKKNYRIELMIPEAKQSHLKQNCQAMRR